MQAHYLVFERSHNSFRVIFLQFHLGARVVTLLPHCAQNIILGFVFISVALHAQHIVSCNFPATYNHHGNSLMNYFLI